MKKFNNKLNVKPRNDCKSLFTRDFIAEYKVFFIIISILKLTHSPGYTEREHAP
jgi:hypothetical protein